jgi:hypothetical protein
MVKKKYVAIAIIVAILAFLAASFFEFTDYEKTSGSIVYGERHNLFFDYSYFIYPAHINVSSDKNNVSIGFDVSLEKIDFGAVVTEGTISRKYINVTNNEKVPVTIEARKYGNISDMVSFIGNDFTLGAGETSQIEIDAKPGAIQSGDYYGQIEIIIKKSRI